MKKVADIDTYIAGYPKAAQTVLKQLRSVIHAQVPKAEEAIKYGIPTFVLHGNLVHFGAYEKHFGFYPGASAIAAFKKEITPYVSSKGAIQFPVGKPLPLSLIRKIIAFRVKENMKRKK